MDEIWLWLVLALVIVIVAVVQQLFFEGIARTGVNVFVWGAEKLMFLRRNPNQTDLKELNQSPHKGKKKSNVSKNRI